jgi:predicted membrane-bound spermidine synthase
VQPSPVRPPAVIVAAFFCSGFASLIDQVAWQRLLTLYYGVGALSITLIVSVYMLGLGFGSLLGGRLARRVRNPYAVYAVLQLSLGAAGLASLPGMAALAHLADPGRPAFALASLVAFLCVPTLLMGMTLPIVVDLVTRQGPDFIGSVSRLYFVNTLGASCGAAVTGFVLVSLLGLDGCIVFAAAIDLALAVVIVRARPADPAAPPGLLTRAEHGPLHAGRMAYPLVFCAGFVAIGYEIVWCRVIGVLVKDSPYAFASVLAIYLLGVALGSLAIHEYMNRKPDADPRRMFFTLQFLIGATVLLTFIGFHHLSGVTGVRDLLEWSFLAEQHPPAALFLPSSGSPAIKDAYLALDVVIWPLVFMLVPTVLMGASFPLIASVALSRRGSEGEAVGRTYFFGVLGNVLGGLVTGLLLLPAVGTEATLLIFGVAGLLFGLVPRAPARTPGAGMAFPDRWRAVAVLVLAALSAAYFPRGGALYRAMHVPPFTPSRVHIREGRDAVVVTYEDGDRVRNFINGQGHGYRPGPIFLAEAFAGLAHAARSARVLVIGFGAGTITEAALMTGGTERVTVVELSGTLIGNTAALPPIARILGDSRVRLVIDDGRRYLRRSAGTFDVILMDPLRTTTAYSNNLHSLEFFALAARRLAPDGVLMVGGLDGGAVVPRTLLAQFPHVRAYPYFCLGSRRPLTLDEARFERLVGAVPDDQRAIIRDLVRDPLEGDALVRATAGWPVNRDWRPVSEYYLGALLMERFRTRAPPWR